MYAGTRESAQLSIHIDSLCSTRREYDDRDRDRGGRDRERSHRDRYEDREKGTGRFSYKKSYLMTGLALRW